MPYPENANFELSPYRGLTRDEREAIEAWDALEPEREFVEAVETGLTDCLCAFERLGLRIGGGEKSIPESGSDLLAKIKEVQSMIEEMK